MSEMAQVILATGVALFLSLVAIVGVIWALRCSPDANNYRNPVMLGLPVLIALAYVTQRLIG